MEAFVTRLGALLDAGSLDQAEALILAEAQRHPARAALGRSALAAARQELPAQLEHAQQAHRLAPNEPIVWQYLALAQARSGDTTEAERSFRQAVSRDAGPRSLGALGNFLLTEGRFLDAHEAYARALERDPTHGQSLNGLATVRHRLGDRPGALRALASAYELAPQDSTPLNSLVNLFGEAGWQLGAIALARIERAGEVSDSVRLTLDLMCLKLLTQVLSAFPQASVHHDADEYVANLMESARSRPARVRLEVARALFDAERLQETGALLGSIATDALSSVERGRFHYLHGLLAEAIQSPDLALTAYSHALEEDSERWDACCNALNLLLERSSALAYAQREALLAKVPESIRARTPQLLYNEAMHLFSGGRVAEARQRLMRIQALLPADDDLCLLAAKTLETQGV